MKNKKKREKERRIGNAKGKYIEILFWQCNE